MTKEKKIMRLKTCDKFSSSANQLLICLNLLVHFAFFFKMMIKNSAFTTTVDNLFNKFDNQIKKKTNKQIKKQTKKMNQLNDTISQTMSMTAFYILFFTIPYTNRIRTCRRVRRSEKRSFHSRATYRTLCVLPVGLYTDLALHYFL